MRLGARILKTSSMQRNLGTAVRNLSRNMEVWTVGLIFSSIFCAVECRSEFVWCDVYRQRNPDNKAEIIQLYVLAGFSIPRKSYTHVLKRNVSCPICNSRESICLRKCCLQEGSFNVALKRCQVAPSSVVTNEFEPSNVLAPWLAAFSLSSSRPTFQLRNYSVLFGSYCASKVFDISLFELSESGNAYIDKRAVRPDDYCVDYFSDKKKFGVVQCERTKLVLEPTDFRKTLCFIGSELSLFVTFCVYAFDEELRALLPNKILLCYVINLLVTYGTYIVLRVGNIYNGTFCTVAALVIQFAFLASFFWLNIMCFDLWCTFSGRHRSYSGSSRESEWKKFIAYCLYAWGCPALIVAVTIFAEFYPSLPKGFIRPQFGTKTCFFETKGAVFIYFYSFLSVIVLTNSCMFIHTAFVLKRHKKQTRVLKRSGSRRHLDHDRQRFNLYLKLFIVMGVNWILEVISFYVPQLEALWLLTDIGNTLQGVLIFSIFVCKRRILVLLNKRLLPNHPFFNKPKKNSSTATSVISLASVRSGIVSSKPPVVQSADKLDEAC